MPRKKRRLLVGEGDMNFAVSYLQKHPSYSDSTVVTEFESRERLEQRPSFVKNYHTLHARRVPMHFGIDARNLNQYKKLPGRFERVHFNFPYVRKDWRYSDENKQLFAEILNQSENLSNLDLQKLNVDKNLINRVMNYASVKHIISKNLNDDEKILEIFIEIIQDLKNYELEQRISELESKFSKDMSESTFNQIKELKKQQKFN